MFSPVLRQGFALTLCALAASACCSTDPLGCYEPNGDSLRVGGDAQVYFHDLRRTRAMEERLRTQLDDDMAELERRVGLTMRPGLDLVLTRDFDNEPKELRARFGPHVDGFYNRERHIVVAEWNRQASQMRATLRHELAHALISPHYPWLPDWLSEGLAACCEPLDSYVKWERLLRFAGRLRDDGPVTAAKVIATPVRNYEQYNDAWALCYVLLTRSGYDPLSLLEAVRTDHVPMPAVEEAFHEFQVQVAGDGFALEDLIDATGGFESLSVAEASELLLFLDRQTKMVVSYRQAGTILEVVRRALPENENRALRHGSRLLRRYLAPFVDQPSRARIGQSPGSARRVRRGDAMSYLQRVLATQSWFDAFVDECLPGSEDLRLELRSRELRAAVAWCGFWLRRQGTFSRDEVRHLLQVEDAALDRMLERPGDQSRLTEMVLVRMRR